jgi:hypothetical protein
VNIVADVNNVTEGKDRYDSKQNWIYPTEESNGVISSSGPGNAEVVEVCHEKLRNKCEGTNGCALLVGVVA